MRQVTGGWIDDVVDWLTVEGSWLFDPLKNGVTYALVYIENVLKWIPWPVVVIALALLAFAVGRWPLLGFTVAALLFIGFMGLWENTIDTLALMVVSVFISVAIGLPLGVFAARNELADRIMRPVLDGMQTMPSFVYLLPGVLFFGLGPPAGVFATIIYAVPPVIRLTNLGHTPGIRGGGGGRPFVRHDPVPAAHQGSDTYGYAYDYGGREPDDHDGACHGDDSQYGRRRRSRRQRSPRACRRTNPATAQSLDLPSSSLP